MTRLNTSNNKKKERKLELDYPEMKVLLYFVSLIKVWKLLCLLLGGEFIPVPAE